MSAPKVSIIVPNYNHAPFLQQRLDSIFGQTYQNIEVILLDDASTDGSLEILKKYENQPKVSKLIVNENNSGSPFVQWKKGMEMAQGEFIWIAETDDYCQPNFLSELLQFNTDNNNELDIIYSQSLDMDANGKVEANRLEYTNDFDPNIWKDNFVLSGTQFITRFLKVKCVIPNASAVIFRRALLESQPLSNDHLQMKICGDWFFWLKIAKNSKIGFVSEALNNFRFHENVTRIQSSFNKVYLRCSEEKIIREYLTTQYDIDQRNEIEVLYKKWFRKSRFSNLFTNRFYHVKLKQSGILGYIKLFFKVHQTREKVLKKWKK